MNKQLQIYAKLLQKKSGTSKKFNKDGSSLDRSRKTPWADLKVKVKAVYSS